MKARKTNKSTKWENVKLRADTVDILRKYKEATMIPIGQVVEVAIKEYLSGRLKKSLK